MDEPWDILLERWLAGALSADEEQQFLAHTNADPARLAQLGRVLRQQALLAEHLGAARQAAPAPHRRWWWGTAAAALIAVLIGWWTIPGATPVARILAGVGEQIERDGRQISTNTLISGDTVRSGASGTRIELIDEATVITCAADTRLRLEVGVHERRIAMLSGRVDASVAPQRADRPLVFSTAEAQVTVVGTQLSVVAGAGTTAVAVQHGAVRVSGATSAGATSTNAVVVAAGQSAQVIAGQAPVSRPLTAGWDVFQGLIGHWPLDEGTGRVAHDASGHGHHSRSLTAAWTIGRTSTTSALTFTGQFGGEWLDLGPQNLGAPSGVTVSAWVKTSALRFGTVFSGGFTVGSGASTLGIKESEVPGADDAAGFVNFLAQQNHPQERLDSPQRITDDRWHHLTWTWSADGWRRIWIDGVQAAERQDASERDRHWNAWHWAIGADSDRLVWNFAGAISEVRVYDRALTTDEIGRLAGKNTP